MPSVKLKNKREGATSQDVGTLFKNVPPLPRGAQLPRESPHNSRGNPTNYLITPPLTQRCFPFDCHISF